jgi:hypothetical protein
VEHFSKPYIAASFTGTQKYRYQTLCMPSDQWIILMGPIAIVRTVYQDATGQWWYKVEKSGLSASYPLP